MPKPMTNRSMMCHIWTGGGGGPRCCRWSPLRPVLPQLEGKLYGMAVRVPTPNVSLIDLVVETERPSSAGQFNEAFRHAADGPLRGILACSDLPLVSIDYRGCPASAVVDTLSTQIIGGNLLKVLAWYGNEWGYASRVVDLLRFMTRNQLVAV